MDRRPGIRPPSPQDPCRRHIHPSPRTPRRCPASGSRNLKPKRLGRTPGSAGGVASQGVDHLAGSGPAGVHLHRQSREPCLTWSDSGSSGGRLTGESFGEPGWWSGCTFLEGRPLPAQAHSHSPPQTSPAGSPPLLPRVSSVSSPPPPPEALPPRLQHPHPGRAPISAGVPDRRRWAAAPQGCPLPLTALHGRAQGGVPTAGPHCKEPTGQRGTGRPRPPGDLGGH